MAGFAAGALTLSALMALVSYQITRHSLLSEREGTAVRAAYYDAAVVRAGVGSADQPDLAGVLGSLDTGESRRAVLQRDGSWYGSKADTTGARNAIPDTIEANAAAGRAAVMRVRADGVPSLVVAIPLTDGSVFYEVDSLQELQHTLAVLTLVLSMVAVGTAAVGAGLGWYATRYVLRPLTRVADAAEGIAAGRSDARLDPAGEPDLARLTESFNHMVDQLSVRNDRDRRFAADVSHELRSPLQTLAAAASVLDRRRDTMDERSATAAGLVTDEISRFQGLVDDLLVLARGDRPAERTGVDVAQLARQVCRERRADEGIVEVAGLEPVWLVDRRRLGQLLANLLENAEAYGGGATAVRLALDEDGLGSIEVDDEGPGVSPDDKAVIFDRFVRGRSAGARAGGDGAGLGLALVAQHAAAHGGTAAALDRPGGGARFRVELAGCRP
jgi:two-component system sensor histidine kinase MtrB